ncbi:hypothetical protein [Beijerinckia sp. L45]|uniref:hypothetical protein n=1 Tax=Beijerinckia sp. L45 TaxID=1641855 RepID=UPI00131DA301|nr:hypothetical protein [Beijerinckia sp. L45]
MTEKTKKIESAVKAIIAKALRDAAEALTTGAALFADLADPADTGEIIPPPRRGYADFYFCGCPGLAALSRKIGVTCFKAGATQQGVLIRQRDLAKDFYAGTALGDGGYTLEPGWNAWEMRQIHSISVAPDSAVSFVSRALRVKLSVPFHVFEKNLRHEMKSLALHEWIKTPAGKAHLAARGVRMSEVERFTVPMFGDDPRMPPDRATEIYMVKPRTDLSKVVAILDRCAKGEI